MVEKQKNPRKLVRIFKRVAIFFFILFLALIIIYIFRVPIFSGLICNEIATLVEEETNFKIKIEEFSGSYFSNIKITNIHLIDGNNVLSELQVDEVYVDFNLFALFSKEKIVRNIIIKNPRIALVAIPSFVKIEEKKETPLVPDKIDIDFILKQIPNVSIQNGSFLYNTVKQKLEIEQLDLYQKDNQGQLNIKKIYAEDGELSQSFSDFTLEFALEDKVFVVKKIKTFHEGYQQSIEFTDLVTLDLNYLEKLPISFQVPTPGGIIDGAIAIASGKYINIKKSEIDFNETLKLISLLQNQETLKEITGKLAFDTNISFPDWDYRKIKGSATINIYKDSIKEWDISQDKKGLNTYLYVEDLKIIEELIHSFTKMKSLNTTGSLALRNSLFIEDEKISSKGSMEESFLQTNYFPKQKLMGNWNASYDLKQKICDIEKLSLNLGGISTHIASFLDFSQKQQSFVDLEFSILSLKEYLNIFLDEKEQNSFDAKVNIELKASGTLPTFDTIATNTDFKGSLSVGINDLVIKRNSIGNVRLTLNFTANNNGIQVSEAIFYLNEEKIAKFKIDSGIKVNEPFSVEGKYRLNHIASKWSHLIPNLEGLFAGELLGKFIINGKIPVDLEKLDIAVDHTLTLIDGNFLDKLPYKKIQIPFKVRVDNEYVHIKQFKCIWEKEKLLDVSGKIGYRPQTSSKIFCNLQIKNPQDKFAAVIPQQYPLKIGKLSLKNTLWGDDLLNNLEFVYLKSKTTIDNVQYHDKQFSNVELKVLSKSSVNSMFIRELKLTADQDILFEIFPTQFQFDRDTLIKVKGKTKVNLAKLVTLPRIKTDILDGSFSVYLRAKSLSLLPQLDQEDISATAFLQDSPEVMMRKIKENFVSLCNLELRSNYIEVDNVKHDNLLCSFSASLQNGKLSVDKLDISLNNEHIVNNEILLDLPSKKVQIKSNINIENIDAYIENFVSPSPVSGNLKFSSFLATKIPEKNEPLNGNGYAQLSISDAKVMDKLSLDKVVFFSKFKTENEKLNLTATIHHNEQQIFKWMSQVSTTAPYRGIIETETSIAKVENYIAPFVDQKIFSGDLLMHYKGQGQLSLSNPDVFDDLQSKFAILCQNGTIDAKPYQKILWENELSVKDKQIEIKKSQFFFDTQKLLELSGKIGHDSDVVATISIPNIGELSSRFAPQQQRIDGEFLLQCFLKGNLLPESFDFAIKTLVQLEKFSFSENTFPSIKLDSNARVQKKQIHVDKCIATCDNITIFNLKGHSGYLPASPFDVTIESNIKNAINHFASSINNKKSQVFNGQSMFVLNAKGSIPSDDNLNLESHLKIPFYPENDFSYWEINLGKISLWGKKTEEINGLDSKITITGTKKSPKIQAHFNYKQDLVKLVDANTRIDDIAFTGSIQQNKMVLQLECLIGGGSVLWDTTVDFDDNYFPQKVRSHIKGNRILLIRNDLLYGRADMDLELVGDVRPTNNNIKFSGGVSGKVDITEFKVTAKMSIESILQSSPERASTNYIGFDSPFVHLDLDVHIHISQAAVYNELAQIKTRGDIWVKGTNTNPQVSGWIGTTSGNLFLPQGNMKITQCNIQLSPNKPLIPQINIVAETEVREYLIFVIIKGTPGDMSIDFSSAPSVPKEDIVTLLLTGGTRSELASSGSQRLQDTGTSIILRQILNTLGIGTFISAQVTPTSASVTVSPESWGGIGLQGKTEQEGNTALNILYRIKFK